MRKQACSVVEITGVLKKGGFDFPWKADDCLRSVAISLSKNSQIFHRLPNNTFGLLAWYPGKKKPTKAGELIKKIGSITEGSESEMTDTASNLEEDNPSGKEGK
ncbi:MAG: hypothetical protein ABSE05_15440 [Syntrophales bacterium]